MIFLIFSSQPWWPNHYHEYTPVKGSGSSGFESEPESAEILNISRWFNNGDDDQTNFILLMPICSRWHYTNDVSKTKKCWKWESRREETLSKPLQKDVNKSEAVEGITCNDELLSQCHWLRKSPVFWCLGTASCSSCSSNEMASCALKHPVSHLAYESPFQRWAVAAVSCVSLCHTQLVHQCVLACTVQGALHTV